MIFKIRSKYSYKNIVNVLKKKKTYIRIYVYDVLKLC